MIENKESKQFCIKSVINVFGDELWILLLAVPSFVSNFS